MARIKVRVGTVEIEVEGAENDIDQLLEKSVVLSDSLRLQGDPSRNAPPTQADLSTGKTSEESASGVFEGTINTAIASLGGNTCREVLLAAAVHITMFDGKDRFTTEEWEGRAKDSNAWKAKWTNSKAKDRKRLIDSNEIIENATGVYSLAQSTREAAAAKLA